MIQYATPLNLRSIAQASLEFELFLALFYGLLNKLSKELYYIYHSSIIIIQSNIHI